MGRLHHTQQHLRLEQDLGQARAVGKKLPSSGAVCCDRRPQLSHNVPQLSAGHGGKHLGQAVLEGAVARSRGTQQRCHLLR
jgi:hypothetical protein